ncbi:MULTISPECIES: hypothetical protein [unclassified Thiocapsa]|uniref:hypothetical protein n=1 Tax=unclassified Thiocapsa TaxID=2641286 RepID=UPI0035B317F2
MSAIDDLIAQIQEPRLREQLKREWAEARKTKTFGLMIDPPNAWKPWIRLSIVT